MESNNFHIAERCFQVFDLEFNFVKSRQCTEFVGLWFVIWSWWVAIKRRAQQTHKGCEGCVNRIDEEKTTLCHT